jgi:hypothetical protein
VALTRSGRPAVTEIRPLPAPLRMPVGPSSTPTRPQQTPVPRLGRTPGQTGARALAALPTAIVEATPAVSPVMRATMLRRARHQARMERLAEARAVAWLVFAVLCCLVLVVVGTLIVGTMLGGWSVPLHS